jgi:hypothetical protein
MSCSGWTVADVPRLIRNFGKTVARAAEGRPSGQKGVIRGRACVLLTVTISHEASEMPIFQSKTRGNWKMDTHTQWNHTHTREIYTHSIKITPTRIENYTHSIKITPTRSENDTHGMKITPTERSKSPHSHPTPFRFHPTETSKIKPFLILTRQTSPSGTTSFFTHFSLGKCTQWPLTYISFFSTHSQCTSLTVPHRTYSREQHFRIRNKISFFLRETGRLRLKHIFLPFGSSDVLNEKKTKYQRNFHLYMIWFNNDISLSI